MEFMLPERGFILPERGFILPERGFILPERGFSLPERVFILPERGFILPERDFILPERGFILPEQYFILPERDFILPERGLCRWNGVLNCRSWGIGLCFKYGNGKGIEIIKPLSFQLLDKKQQLYATILFNWYNTYIQNSR